MGTLRRWAGIWLLALVAAGCGQDPKDRGGERGGVVFSAAEVEEGRRLYLRYGCAVCHGEEGRGDGRVALALNPKPRDFRDLSAYKNGASAEEIAGSIASGVMNRGTGMPAYPHIPKDERLLIAGYVVALQERLDEPAPAPSFRETP